MLLFYIIARIKRFINYFSIFGKKAGNRLFLIFYYKEVA